MFIPLLDLCVHVLSVSGTVAPDLLVVSPGSSLSDSVNRSTSPESVTLSSPTTGEQSALFSVEVHSVSLHVGEMLTIWISAFIWEIQLFQYKCRYMQIAQVMWFTSSYLAYIA